MAGSGALHSVSESGGLTLMHWKDQTKRESRRKIRLDLNSIFNLIETIKTVDVDKRWTLLAA